MKPFKEAVGYAEDLQAAYDYYKAYNLETAERFLTAYQDAIRILKGRPRICRPRRNDWRQMIIQPYPNYSIFYKELSFCWLLAGVIPAVRDPDMIQARLLLREVAESETG
ncbi:MAG: type II toxin-antitoxin system RelE/ParE family toxin [Opitutaceae bacterium]|nr:type II toxin-antitoxin system RelE/ParE family toxin [Opitutaceae bacterium]